MDNPICGDEIIYEKMAEHSTLAYELYQAGDVTSIRKIRRRYIAAYDRMKQYADSMGDDVESVVAYGNAYWTLCDIRDFLYWLDDLCGE